MRQRQLSHDDSTTSETHEDQFKSPDSVKSEQDVDSGHVSHDHNLAHVSPHVYRSRDHLPESQQPGAAPGYLMGVPGIIVILC